MKKTQLISLLIIVSLSFTLIPAIEAATDEWVTRTLDEDLFFAAYRFDDVDMVYLQGDGQQIRSWLRFEGPVVQYGRYIVEAYLSVKIASVGGTDPGASMTIYGVPSKQGGAVSYYDDPDQINGPYTNSYNVNLSSFVDAGAWHNITVTNILREISQGYYHYDGHDVAFVTLSSSDHDAERTITSEESGNAAKLYIHYGTPDQPPGFPPDAQFVEEYRNYSIWNWTIESQWVNYSAFTKVDSGDGTINFIDSSEMTVVNIHLNSRVYAYQNNTEDDFSIKFGVNTTELNDLDGAHTEQWAILYGASKLSGWLEDNEEVAYLYAVGDNNIARRWRYSIKTVDTGPVNTWTNGIWYTQAERLNVMQYLKFTYNGTDNSYTLVVYSDLEMTVELETIAGDKAGIIGPINYHYAFAPVDHDSGDLDSRLDATFFSDIENDDEAGDFFGLIDENGTIIDTWTLNGENFTDIDDIKDFVDEEVIGYPNPEDPTPPGWDEESWLTTNRFKFILFIVGMVLFVGSPVYGFAERPEAATWIILMMNMIVGVALLWSLQTM